METVDLNKLKIAITYVQRIVDGCNPVNNLPVDEDSVLNNPNMIRCMYFIKEVLEEVKRNNGIIGIIDNKNKQPFPFEILNEFKYEEDKSIAHFLNQLHAPVKGTNIKKITPQAITGWLKNKGYLTMEYSKQVEKESTVPTEKGKILGLYTEIRTYTTNSYLAVIYNRNAQEFLIKNMKKIVNGEDIE